MEARTNTAGALFNRFSRACARAAGKPATFVTAAAAVLIWAMMGPIFHYDSGWQLVINTSTTIITFLMIFLIQNTQNRESDAVHIKLDELIRAIGGAENSLLNCESMSDEELERLQRHYDNLARIARTQRGARSDAATSEWKGSRGSDRIVS